MSERIVRIISSEEKGPNVSCGDYYDGPDREEYALEGVNCTVDEFIEWFLETERGEDFCAGDKLIDIGGSSLDMTPGSLLSVTFDEYITGWSKRVKQFALNQIHLDAMAAYDRLGIEHFRGEPLCLKNTCTPTPTEEVTECELAAIDELLGIA